MTITITDIQNAFDELETGAKTREEIAEFAVRAMKCDDQGVLKMEPLSESKRIWEAIKYLSGVDLREEPDTYLHSNQDFAIFREKMNERANHSIGRAKL